MESSDLAARQSQSMNNSIQDSHVCGPCGKTMFVSGVKTVDQDAFVRTVNAGVTCRIMWVSIRWLRRWLSTWCSWIIIRIIHGIFSLTWTLRVRSHLVAVCSMMLMLTRSSWDWPRCLNMQNKGVSSSHEMQLPMVTWDLIPTKCDQAAMIYSVAPMDAISPHRQCWNQKSLGQRTPLLQMKIAAQNFQNNALWQCQANDGSMCLVTKWCQHAWAVAKNLCKGQEKRHWNLLLHLPECGLSTHHEDLRPIVSSLHGIQEFDIQGFAVDGHDGCTKYALWKHPLYPDP